VFCGVDSGCGRGKIKLSFPHLDECDAFGEGWLSAFVPDIEELLIDLRYAKQTVDELSSLIGHNNFI
jgi:hypothetical protein